MIKFREAALEDALAVARNLRDADAAKILALGDKPLNAVLMGAYKGSEVCLVATLDGKPVMICGVCRHGADVGFPWMLVTKELTKRPRGLLAAGKAAIETLQGKFPVLTCPIEANDSRGIRLMAQLGFENIGECPEYGAALQFARFR